MFFLFNFLLRVFIICKALHTRGFCNAHRQVKLQISKYKIKIDNYYCTSDIIINIRRPAFIKIYSKVHTRRNKL